MAVLAIVAAVDVVLLFVMGGTSEDGISLGGMLAASVVTLAIIGAASMFRTASLRTGGGAVAQQMGATPVAEDTSDFNLRRLRNVVEEIAIASGVPVPQIFVLEDEAAINAFAAGYAPSDASITVTRGALNRLNRDELQGVIAHEFSHVLNGDMRLNIRLIGLLFGILVLAVIGRKILEHGRFSRSKDSAPLIGVALGLLVVGYVGLFFGRLIKAGLSRQREYLADASAVQFTRNPDSIGGALVGSFVAALVGAGSGSGSGAGWLFTGAAPGGSALPPFCHENARKPPLGTLVPLTPTRDGTRVEIVHDLKFRVTALAWLAEPVIDGFFIGHVAGRTLARFKEHFENGK